MAAKRNYSTKVVRNRIGSHVDAFKLDTDLEDLLINANLVYLNFLALESNIAAHKRKSNTLNLDDAKTGAAKVNIPDTENSNDSDTEE